MTDHTETPTPARFSPEEAQKLVAKLTDDWWLMFGVMEKGDERAKDAVRPRRYDSVFEAASMLTAACREVERVRETWLKLAPDLPHEYPVVPEGEQSTDSCRTCKAIKAMAAVLGESPEEEES